MFTSLYIKLFELMIFIKHQSNSSFFSFDSECVLCPIRMCANIYHNNVEKPEEEKMICKTCLMTIVECLWWKLRVEA